MSTVTLTIDGKQVTVTAATTILWAALDNGIYIPHLCALREKIPQEPSCRLCWVEIEGKPEPVPACTQQVEPGMAVNTAGKRARELARSAFALLMASHDLDCKKCPANCSCELQKIAAHLRAPLKPKNLRAFPRKLPVDDSHPLFNYNPNRCVLCGQCVWVCRHDEHSGVLGFAHRGFERRMTTFADEPMGDMQCLNCTRCVEACPTGALSLKKPA